jgi:hypothetical protein
MTLIATRESLTEDQDFPLYQITVFRRDGLFQSAIHSV